MKMDNIIMIAFIYALLFLAVSLIINTSKSCDVSIDYDVTVDTNSTGVGPNIVEVKLACYKMCIEELKGRERDFNNCLDKCEALE